MNDDTHFDDLLRHAQADSPALRLLLVFAKAEIPDDATPSQRAAFEAGQGGALAPILCVDKAPNEIASFNALVEESRSAGPAWSVVFVAALESAAQPLSATDIEGALTRMVEGIRVGAADRFAAFGRDGCQLRLN